MKELNTFELTMPGLHYMKPGGSLHGVLDVSRQTVHDSNIYGRFQPRTFGTLDCLAVVLHHMEKRSTSGRLGLWAYVLPRSHTISWLAIWYMFFFPLMDGSVVILKAVQNKLLRLYGLWHFTLGPVRNAVL
jgi:hypothetical protein